MAYEEIKSSGKTVSEKVYADLDLFFRPHPVTGDISLKYDTDAIKRAVRNIVTTNFFERPFKPGFGTNIRNMLFELDNRRYHSKYANDIEKTILDLEPRVTNVKVKFGDVNRGNSINIQISFYIRQGNLDQQNLTVTLSRVR
jgi:phage baseplate assembly protein W